MEPSNQLLSFHWSSVLQTPTFPFSFFVVGALFHRFSVYKHHSFYSLFSILYSPFSIFHFPFPYLSFRTWNTQIPQSAVSPGLQRSLSHLAPNLQTIPRDLWISHHFEIPKLYTFPSSRPPRSKNHFPQCATSPPSSSRSSIPRTHPYACPTPTSASRMSSPTTKQTSTAEPVPLRSHPQNQTSPRLVGTQHPRRPAGNVWAIFLRNPAETLKHTPTPPRPAVMCLGHSIFHSTICLTHLLRYWTMPNAFLAMCKMKEDKKPATQMILDGYIDLASGLVSVSCLGHGDIDRKLWIANEITNWNDTKWCARRRYLAIRVLSSVWPLTVFWSALLALVRLTRGQSFAPLWLFDGCCTSSHWFGFELGLGSGFDSRILGFGFGLILWHMYRNQVPQKKVNANGPGPAFVDCSLLVNITSFLDPGFFDTLM